MSLLSRRVERLEGPRLAGRKTFESALEDFFILKGWLAERGYSDHLAANEAGESGPAGLDALLQELAGYDRQQRSFARIEAALDRGNLPDERRPLSAGVECQS